MSKMSKKLVLVMILLVPVSLFMNSCELKAASEDNYPSEGASFSDEDILLTLFPDDDQTGNNGEDENINNLYKARLEAEKLEIQHEAEYLREEAERLKAEEEKAAKEKAEKEKAEKEEAERLKAEEEQKKKDEAASGIVTGPLGVLMGSYTTYFSGSGENRIYNIQHAADILNGTVIEAGEEFSVSAAIGPINEDNGYRQAGAYQDGKLIESVGGGVCQISSTLYNAALGAELEITERCEHSMTVGYIDLSRDAAIAGDYKDLKFINNSGAAITIESWATSDGVTFKIWGADTAKKNGRSFKLETVILETIDPGDDVIEVDESKAADYYEVTQSAHTGYRTELYKVVYVDGVETDCIKINSSVYEASPAYITVGK